MDDDLPRAAPVATRDLAPMSIDELHGYIEEMEAEIGRVRAEIARKQAHRAGMDALFRK